MPRRLRPIGHDDRLSVVDHLDELRSRLIVCFAVLVVAFGFCFWQNAKILNLLNKPYQPASAHSSNKLNGITQDNVSTGRHLRRVGSDLTKLSTLHGSGLSPQARSVLAQAGREVSEAGASLPQKSPPAVPLTLNPGEPFTISITVAFYAAVLVSLPVLLYEIYAFVVPALRPEERRVAAPIVTVAPILFACGVVFTYLVVLPHAIKFLQGYNSSQFDAFVQAKPLYTFEVAAMGLIGIAFEMPLILLGLQAVGLINGQTLTKHWRYAVVLLAVVAAAMPVGDPVTIALEVAPLAILFVASIVLLKLADRRDARRAAAELHGHPVGADD